MDHTQHGEVDDFYTRETDEYILFNAGIFEQWYITEFTVDNRKYMNATQYMMAEKAVIMGDWNLYVEIEAESDPHVCAKLGRQINGFDQKIWDLNKKDIVYKGNYAKFSQNKILKHQLVKYNSSKKFVSACKFDKIWGCGLDINDPAVDNCVNWTGQNLLGIILTQVRDQLLALQTRKYRQLMTSLDVNVWWYRSMQDLVHGYIKSRILPENHQYPLEIVKVFVAFLGNLFMKFDAFSEEYKSCIFENGKAFESKNEDLLHGMIGCEYGFKNGIKSFHILCDSGSSDVIGITSDINVCKSGYGMWILSAPGNSYYIYNGRMFCGNNTKNRHEPIDDIVKWKQNDIVTVKIDCDSWKVSFYINDNQIGKVWDIMPDCVYYPVMCVQNIYARYEFVDND